VRYSGGVPTNRKEYEILLKEQLNKTASYRNPCTRCLQMMNDTIDSNSLQNDTSTTATVQDTAQLTSALNQLSLEKLARVFVVDDNAHEAHKRRQSTQEQHLEYSVHTNPNYRDNIIIDNIPAEEKW
jgi:hypothetical protein